MEYSTLLLPQAFSWQLEDALHLGGPFAEPQNQPFTQIFKCVQGPYPHS